jgi:site-specific DNA recombinase
MGRLTLNVLLSFAQFEREVTSERIRDKIAASKRKGLWVGGNLPLGYEMKDGKIAVVEEDAELVRSIFRRYLELGSVNELLRDLRDRDIRTKSKLLSTGATRGGIPFGHGTLYYLLSNRFYIGEVKYNKRLTKVSTQGLGGDETHHAVIEPVSADAGNGNFLSGDRPARRSTPN